MRAKCFVDSNILVYARDASEPDKQPRARAWLDRLWLEKSGRISVQVLNEYYVTVTQKLKPGLPAGEAWEEVQDYFAWDPIPTTPALLNKGRDIQEAFGFSWWDALIVAAARTACCEYLLTEDLQAGQDLGGVTVISPFSKLPADIWPR